MLRMLRAISATGARQTYNMLMMIRHNYEWNKHRDHSTSSTRCL